MLLHTTRRHHAVAAAAVFGLSGALAPHAAAARGTRFVRYDGATHTATIQIIAGYNSVAGGFNFDGGARGSVVVTVPLKFVVTGVLAAYDLLDYPLSQRGQSVADRVAFIRANFAAVLGFGVATAALLLIPGVGLFLLPFGVAGATRMVVDADR